MKRWATTSVLAILGLLGIGASALIGGEDAPGGYRFAKVEMGSIVSTVSASGSLKPTVTAFVAAQGPGQVKEVPVALNEEVKAGQVVARLDADAAQARLDTALAELEVARHGVEIARRQVDRARYEADNAKALAVSAEADTKRAEVTAVDAGRDRTRKRKLATTGDVAPADAERSDASFGAASAGVASAKARSTAAAQTVAAERAQVAVAEAELDNASATVQLREAAVRQARIDVDHLSLRAPIDGVIVERNITIGQSVGMSAAAPPLFAIAADLRHLELHATVAEADVGKLAVGQPATFVFDAFPGQTFAGNVREIATQPQPLQNVVAYDVVFQIDNEARKLLPGMTADVRIVIGQRDNVLKIPNAALSLRPPGHDMAPPDSGAEVWQLGRDGRPHEKVVQTGLTDGMFTEVVDGDLTQGDNVVVAWTQPAGSGAHVGPLKF